MPLIALDTVSIALRHRLLLDGFNLLVEAGERLAVIGRNGSGKSTLLQILSGELPADCGTIARSPALRVSRFSQDAAATSDQTVFDTGADGLGDLAEVVAEYRRAAVRVSEDESAEAMANLDRAQHALDECDGWRVEQRVELILSRLNLDGDRAVQTLSSGWRGRVLLAKALVAQPTLLLLDKPTNHLDIDAIVWLEAFLADYAGAVVFVTHDREFLQQVSTRVVELSISAGTSALSSEIVIRWRAEPAAARAAPDAARERPDPRRTHQRSRYRDAFHLNRQAIALVQIRRPPGRICAIQTNRQSNV